MENFRRSLRYLRPHRFRLGLAILCVVLIAVLWGGGLATLLPGAKVLISEEGLHGWAWQEMVRDRIGARIVERSPVDRTALPGAQRAFTAKLGNVVEGGPADEAGLKETQLIRLPGAQPPMSPKELNRYIALQPAGEQVPFVVYDPRRREQREVTLPMSKLGAFSFALGKVARAIPEPTDYRDRYPLLLGLLAIGFGITILRDLLRFVQEFLVESVVWQAMMDLRCENFTTALHLPITFFAQRGTTDTMSRFVADTNELARGQVTLFGKTLVEPAKASVSVILALMLSWKLTLLAMLAGPPTFIIIRKLGKYMRRASRRALQSWSRMLGVLGETLTGIRVVKAYTMEGGERKRFFRVNRELLSQQRRMAAIDAATAPTAEALGITAGICAAGFAGYLVFNRQMDPHYFLTWMAALAAMFDPVRKLAKVATRFQRADAAAARVFELADAEKEKSPPGAPMLPPHEKSVAFEDVRFRYPGARDEALRGIDLIIEAGQTIAVVGPNGCGKTTLVSLLPRLLEPTKGRVLIDDRDVSQYSLRSLRRQIGLVTQRTVLFDATVAENIAYGLRRPRREAVLDAARKAFVDEFIHELPDGYETVIGQAGGRLSGGQRQRIAIARAILRDPAILIFDEAMSQIDTHSEQRIHQAMTEFIRGRTTLMIAHRINMLTWADRIVVMDEGRIVDAGGHEELLRRCELYQHLCSTEFVRTP